jgi:enamine deaminase RidA (YjgF/YER057c/UK114 family)
VQPNLPYTYELEICNVTAVSGAQQEGAYVAAAGNEWVRPHAEPISDTAKRGNMLFSSRVAGREQADGTNEERIEIQIAKSFESLSSHVTAAGGSLDTIGRVDVWVDGLAAKFLHDREWDKMFGGAANAPAAHIHHQSEGLVPGWHHRMEFTAFVA